MGEKPNTYKGRSQSLVIRQDNRRHRRFGHDGPEAGRTHTEYLLGIDAGRGRGQRGSQPVHQDGLSERDEDGGAEVLAKADERGADGQLVSGQIGLHGRDRLLHGHATGKAVQELIAHPGSVGGGRCEGGHETRSNGCQCAPRDDEWSVETDFGDCWDNLLGTAKHGVEAACAPTQESTGYGPND